MKLCIKAWMFTVILGFGMSTAQAVDLKPYLGLGVVDYQLDLPSGLGAANSTGYFVQGGIDFNDYVGAELRVGTSKTATKAIGASTFKFNNISSAFAKLQTPDKNFFKLYGLLGGTFSNSTQSLGAISLTQTKSSASYGGGIGMSDQGFTLSAEWIRYYADVSGISGTLQYSF